jgi:phosphate-selective porin OprO and OprP
MDQKTSKGIAIFLAAIAMVISDTSWATEKTLKVGGRVQVDYTTANIDTPDININDTEVRRARLNVSGKYGSKIKYKFEINKASGKSVKVEDAYIQFIPSNSKVKVKLGQFKTHNSLDEQTSSRFISTLERSAFTDAFAFDRRVGASVGTSGDNFTFDAGVFTTNLENDGGADEGHAISARGTFNPIKTDQTLVHLGTSWRYRKKGETESDIRYRQRPFTHVAPNRIVDTGRFAGKDNFIGAEAAIIHNNLWASGEYAVLNVKGNDLNENADFSGFYGELGMFFGGKKTYKGGKFNRPKITNSLGKGGIGAVSLVARYDSLDLEDGPYSGELKTLAIGADWWPTQYTRLGINYFNADAEGGTAESANGLVTRLQFDF